MAAVSPPLLPVTVLPAAATTTTTTATIVLPAAATTTTTTATIVLPVPDASSAVDPRAYLARLLDSAKRSLSGARPWAELLDRAALSRPDSLADAAARARKNLAYFRVNYALLVALSLAASLLAHPFALAALAAWCVLYLLRPADGAPLAAFGRTFSDRETLGGLVAASAFVVFLTSVGTIVFSAVALGAAIACAHGAFRVPEEQLFLDEGVQVAGGGGSSLDLLSFFTNAAGGGGR